MTIEEDGCILNVFKPQGMSSFDVVRQIRRKFKIKKIGHSGTLDPIAQGVLLILIGKATKLAPKLSSLNKTYRVGILLGKSTDTYDITGEIITESNTLKVKLENIKRVLAGFLGEIEQIPPKYSALKVKGQRLYKLARQGVEVEIKPRKVKIFNITLDQFNNPHLVLTVHCSKGTYMRSLAHDIGVRVGCGGCMESLVRMAIGEYRVENAIKIEDIILQQNKFIHF